MIDRSELSTNIFKPIPDEITITSEPPRICVIIPTYDNASTIRAVVSCAMAVVADCIVVNDGSTDQTAKTLAQIPGIDVVSFPVNRGKGCALRAGFERAAARGFTHAITMDADGQHLAVDLKTFLQKINEEPLTLWIGNRTLLAGGVAQPPRSRFGRRFGAFWYRFHTSQTINDTQCGFRAYPLAATLALACRSTRYEYEIEVLIHAAWNGTPVKEFAVRLFYAQGKEYVSHFRPVRDFCRISVINSRAAIMRIFLPGRAINTPGRNFREKLWNLLKQELKAHTTPHRAAFSLALGVFFGIFPIHGFQVLALLGFSMIFPINRPLAFVGVSISSAPLLPFILYAGYVTGVWMVPAVTITLPGFMQKYQDIVSGGIQWFVGSVALSVVAGLVTYLVAFWILERMEHKALKNITS